MQESIIEVPHAEDTSSLPPASEEVAGRDSDETMTSDTEEYISSELMVSGTPTLPSVPALAKGMVSRGTQRSLSRPYCRSKETQVLIEKKDASTTCDLVTLPRLTRFNEQYFSDSDGEDSEPDAAMVDSQNQDQDFDPDEWSSQSEDEDDDIRTFLPQPDVDATVHEGRKYIVFEDSLMALLSVCPNCGAEATITSMRVRGALLTAQRSCSSCQINIKPWKSSPMAGKTACTNLVMSSSIYTSGASISKVMRMFKLMNVAAISKRTVNRHATAIIQPTISIEWKEQQTNRISQLKGKDGGLVVAGDGRCDSPGHTAKYGSFTFIEQRLQKVVTLQLVQKNEVKNSAWMEHEGLRRAVGVLLDEGLTIETIVTDRHTQNAAWIRKNLPDVTHYFDIWHVAKGLSKKIDALSKQKDCEDLSLWKKSICNHVYYCAASSANGDAMVAKFKAVSAHVQNIHSHDDPLYPACDHEPLTTNERQWLESGSKAAIKLEEVLHKKTLLNGISQLSPVYQTSSLEAKHSLDIQFVPKHTAFSYWGMYTRLLLASMHYNENSGRMQAVTKSGRPMYSYKFPRAKKGQPVVAVQKTQPTFHYAANIIRRGFRLYGEKTNVLQEERQHMKSAAPPPLSASFDVPDKDQMVKDFKSRFRKNTLRY